MKFIFVFVYASNALCGINFAANLQPEHYCERCVNQCSLCPQPSCDVSANSIRLTIDGSNDANDVPTILVDSVECETFNYTGFDVLIEVDSYSASALNDPIVLIDTSGMVSFTVKVQQISF